VQFSIPTIDVGPPLGVDGVFFWSLTSVILVVAEEAGGREGEVLVLGITHSTDIKRITQQAGSRRQQAGANVGSVLRTDSPGHRSDVRRSTN
jgi:hypothetical protein